jgi:predicted TIM-barrel fold metal-dependent hydrolase
MPKDWSEEDHLKLMTDRNITKSIISLSSPGTHLKWDSKNFTAAGELSRKCNDFAADLKKRHPDRFGFFTTLPLPDVQASIVEIERAYAAGADGVSMLTSYHDMYQGDERLAPLYEILNKRNSVVFLHPTTPCNPLPNLPSPILEFYFDTARAATNLFFTDTVARYPNIVWILSHGGGALPSIFSRATGFSQMVSGAYKPIEEEYMRQQLNQKFYFDLAGFTFPGQYKFLMDKDGPGIGLDRLVYGSDFPYTGAPRVQLLAERMANATRAWKEADRENVYMKNAERMLKRG